MKRDLDNLDLRGAFKPMPDECRNALITAACSVKEEEPVKRVTFRAVLIAACIIIAATAIAMAAGQIFGWTDFFSGYYDISVPQDTVQIMKDNGEISHTIGPVTFTVGGLYCDGYTATTSVVAKATGESGILLTGDDPYDAVGANGENGDAVAEKLGVDPDTSWVDAAKQLNRPLYSVRAVLEIPEELSDGEQFEDPLFNEDGSLTYFSCAMMNGKASGEKVDCQVRLRVAEINLNQEEDEPKAVWEGVDVSIPLQAPVETGEYVIPENTGLPEGIRLESVRALRMPAGVYLLADYLFPEDMDEETFWDNCENYSLDFVRPDGTEFPFGMNLSGCGVLNQLNDLPVIHMMQMIPGDSIPEAVGILLTGPGKTVLTLDLKK